MCPYVWRRRNHTTFPTVSNVPPWSTPMVNMDMLDMDMVDMDMVDMDMVDMDMMYFYSF